MVFELSGVEYSHDAEKAVDGVSLCLGAGRFHAVLGPNGCGKTTLLDLLCGHLVPDRGSLLHDGREVASWGKKELARRIALVPQEYHVGFPYTARELVGMGRYPHMPRFAVPSARDEDAVDAALATCHAEHLADRYVTELSGGEKQRVVFARALAQDTPVLLLDEPCANLDVKHALLLMDVAARRVAEGATVMAVMHDVNLACRYADDLVFMKNGRVAACGPTLETLTGATLREVFDVEARVAVEPALSAPQVVFLR
ncbi:MAG: ABC transporter ATP-binding protein [Desulfatibacillaceae bacterium]